MRALRHIGSTGLLWILSAGSTLLFTGRASAQQRESKSEKHMTQQVEKRDTATLGAGCFWCTEAVFESLKGVQSVVSGFSGGTVKHPTYSQVSTGTTGHAEVANIVYDPTVISFAQLLEVFWQLHDPTTLNRQGNDVGTQYRSVIFYHDAEQKRIAEASLREAQQGFERPIVTQIKPFEAFYPAGAAHQEYYRLNGKQPYCQYVIRPKVKKIAERFSTYLKDH